MDPQNQENNFQTDRPPHQTQANPFGQPDTQLQDNQNLEPQANPQPGYGFNQAPAPHAFPPRESHENMSTYNPSNYRHQPEVPAQRNNNTPAILILQWLTYAFWGWTLIAMASLTAAVFYSLLGEGDSGDFTIYSIAAVLVLLPISAVCDFFYSKHEPAKKQGAASVIMIIHAVIFALFGIGSVITAVFAIVSAAINGGDSTGSTVTFFTAIVTTVLYALTFMRTMAFKRFVFLKKRFTLIMIIIVGIIVLLGIFIPVRIARETRNDRLISSNLSTIQYAINDYARANEKLPEKLSDLELKDDAKIVVDKSLVRYTINNAPSSNNLTDDNYGSPEYKLDYYYTLCATFVKDSNDDYYGYNYSNRDSSGYTSNPNFYAYKAGETCYKIQAYKY